MRRRTIVELLIFGTAFLLALVAGTGHWPGGGGSDSQSPPRLVAVPGVGGVEAEGEEFDARDAYWNDRVTYPTGHYNPAWLRTAARQDARISRGVPAGPDGRPSTDPAGSNWTSLGPRPEQMNGCTGCYNYGLTEGRINDIVVDPTTTTNGSIVAYAASVGGGVWKTTNCCSSATTWAVTTDNPLISAIAIDTLVIDPQNHNTIYAGTGDLNYGSFSMGSQGILKSTDAGATWTVLGAEVFGPAYQEPAGQFPQYDAVGKVRVDPNNPNRVVAGTKRGLFFSYNGGVDWTGPCATNGFTTHRQDITGLELTNMGSGVTRIIAAVGPRGFATTVQYDLGFNGANGLYAAAMLASGCPTFTSITSNANGFVYGNAVTGSPYATGANMNATSGVHYANPTTGNQLGRIDIAVAPSNPDVIYAQVQSIAGNTVGQCGGAPGCQLGVWATTNGGTSWSFMAGSAGPSLGGCGFDYPQNWYDQGLAVDPNNADRLFVDTYDIWFANRTGSTFTDITCGYNGTSGRVVHVDQHALAFVNGSSSILLAGSDGGAYSTLNANVAPTMPTWINMVGGLNTIEFYSGDISGNFAISRAVSAAGGAQDNGPSVVGFDDYPRARRSGR